MSFFDYVPLIQMSRRQYIVCLEHRYMSNQEIEERSPDWEKTMRHIIRLSWPNKKRHEETDRMIAEYFHSNNQPR